MSKGSSVEVSRTDTTPAGVTCPTPVLVVNHTLPSRPDVIRNPGSARGVSNSVIAPAGVIRPTCPASVNQTLPSGPAVIPYRNGEETRNSVNVAVARVHDRGDCAVIPGSATAVSKPTSAQRDLPRLVWGSTLRQRMKFSDKAQYLRYLVNKRGI